MNNLALLFTTNSINPVQNESIYTTRRGVPGDVCTLCPLYQWYVEVYDVSTTDNRSDK